MHKPQHISACLGNFCPIHLSSLCLNWKKYGSAGIWLDCNFHVNIDLVCITFSYPLRIGYSTPRPRANILFHAVYAYDKWCMTLRTRMWWTSARSWLLVCASMSSEMHKQFARVNSYYDKVTRNRWITRENMTRWYMARHIYTYTYIYISKKKYCSWYHSPHVAHAESICANLNRLLKGGTNHPLPSTKRMSWHWKSTVMKW